MLIHVPTPGILRRLLRGEQGQDLVEYTLMVAFVAMTSAAIFLGAGGNINVVWVSAGSTLQGAANPGTGNPPDTNPPDTNPPDTNPPDNGGHGDHGHGDDGH
jgi:Flp pilus assembly pilin Flp